MKAIIFEETDECEWYTFIGGYSCDIPATTAMFDVADPTLHEAHLCGIHAVEALERYDGDRIGHEPV
jgi:hypothetical protein